MLSCWYKFNDHTSISLFIILPLTHVPKLMFLGSAFTDTGLAIADRAIALNPERSVKP